MARPTEAELDQHLRELTHWHSFALHLPGMEQTHISVIKENNPHDVEKQKLALYGKWLSICPSASWSDVVQALEDAGELSMANKIRANIPLALMPVQFENIQFSGDVAGRLMDLHTEFLSLTIEVKKKVEQQPKILKDFISHVKEEPFQINLKSIKNSDEFFAAIRPHYNFLDCYLMVNLALILSGSIADRARRYQYRINKVMKCTKIKKMHRRLGCFFQRHQSGCKVEVSIKVPGVYGEAPLSVVDVLVKVLFRLKHPSECQWFRVLPGSVELVFLAERGKVSILLDTSRKNEAFMRLVGIFQLKIGSEVVLQDEENEAFTFESSLKNANKADNPEAIFFLSECVSFKSRKIAQTGVSPPETKKPLPLANLPRSEAALPPQTRKPLQKHEDETQKSDVPKPENENISTKSTEEDESLAKLPTKDDEVIQELERLHFDFLSLTREMKCLIESEVKNKTKRVEDFVLHAQKQDLFSIGRLSSVETTDDFLQLLKVIILS